MPVTNFPSLGRESHDEYITIFRQKLQLVPGGGESKSRLRPKYAGYNQDFHDEP
ncbi:MAG: hypothetical protein JWP06_170 [Candidatus Saccharibacteria bacterium]|nr:hypothetical protein [Candidatus Saccharibacteria bacterium]